MHNTVRQGCLILYIVPNGNIALFLKYHTFMKYHKNLSLIIFSKPTPKHTYIMCITRHTENPQFLAYYLNNTRSKNVSFILKYHKVHIMKESEETKELVKQKFISNKSLVVILFTKKWFGACQLMESVISKIETNYKDKVETITIDIEKNPEEAIRYNIENLPTTLIFKNKRIIEDYSELVPYNILANKLNQIIRE